MAEDELDNTFDRFYQVDHSSNPVWKGYRTGIDQRVGGVDGGTHQVKSKLGKGSEFEVQIPIARNDGNHQGLFLAL